LRGVDIVRLDRTTAWPSSFLSYGCVGNAMRLKLQFLL
jgi:hypothetical protein